MSPPGARTAPRSPSAFSAKSRSELVGGCTRSDRLPRVEQPQGIERRLDPRVEGQHVAAELPLEPAALQQPDAVLAGQGAAEVHGGLEDRVACTPDRLRQ